MIYVIANLTVAPDKREAVLAAARPAIAETRKEQGCVSYELFQSAENPNEMVFVERWESRDALNAHARSDHFRVWRKATADAFTGRKLEILSDAKVESM